MRFSPSRASTRMARAAAVPAAPAEREPRSVATPGRACAQPPPPAACSGRAFNTGLFAARNTPGARAFLAAWSGMLTDPAHERHTDPAHRCVCARVWVGCCKHNLSIAALQETRTGGWRLALEAATPRPALPNLLMRRPLLWVPLVASQGHRRPDGFESAV